MLSLPTVTMGPQEDPQKCFKIILFGLGALIFILTSLQLIVKIYLTFLSIFHATFFGQSSLQLDVTNYILQFLSFFTIL